MSESLESQTAGTLVVRFRRAVTTGAAAIVLTIGCSSIYGVDGRGGVDTSQYAEAEPTQDSSVAPVLVRHAALDSSRSQIRMRAHGFISESYDNNILDYSDHDRALFESSLLPNQRFGIHSLHDQITDIGAHLSWDFGKRRQAWRVRLKGEATLFALNTFRHYTQWGLELRRTMHHTYAEAGISWLPKYNLRNLYWRPMAGRPFGVRYTAANFSRVSYDAEVGSALSNRLDARLNFSLALNNYNYPFDERDNHAISEVSHLSYDLSRRIVLSGSVGFAQCRAAGRDSVNAIVKDISYNAFTAGIGVRVKCDRRGRVVASGSVDYQHQRYRSAKPLDVSHYHRLDDDYEFGSSLSWRLTDWLQPELSYTYRMSKSSVVVSSADFGSFTAGRLGLQLVSYF
jgi:hypothetical protein